MSIDNRVVNMEFNNAQFQKGINDSTASLSKFNNDLNALAGGTFGSSFDKMSAGIDTVASRFSWFGDLGYQAIHKINEAILSSMGTLYEYSSLVLNPMSGMGDGWSEYNLELNSTKTIMSATGADLETVNETLARLNEYSDKTIYNFNHMTTALAKFNNAGISLEDSEKAIIGIFNAAGLAGANAEEANRAAYNVSQAMAKGFMGLVDWKSIENANMSTAQFREYLVDTAIAAGTVGAELNNATGEMEYWTTTTNNMGKAMNVTNRMIDLFSQGLQYQWLSADVLTKALGDYGDQTLEIGRKAQEAAQQVNTFSKFIDTFKEALGSGWSRSFKIMFGDLEESTKLWTDASIAFSEFTNRMGDSRNAFLEGWDSLGGRDAIIAGLKDAFGGLADLLNTIGGSFRNIFPAMTIEQAANLSKSFANLMNTIRPSEKTLDRLSRIFDGIFAAIDIMLLPLKGIIMMFSDLFGLFASFNTDGDSFLGMVLEFLAVIGDFVVAVHDAIYSSSGFALMFEKIGYAVQNLVNLNFTTISNGIKGIAMAFTDFFNAINAKIDFVGIFTRLTEEIRKALQSFADFTGIDLTGMFTGMVESIRWFSEEFGAIIKEIFLFVIDDLINDNPIVSGLVNGLINGIPKVVKAIIDIAKKIIDEFKYILGIHSPSTVFFEFGRNIIQGLVGGITSGYNAVVGAISRVANDIANGFGFVWDKTAGFFSNIGTNIVNFFKYIWQAIKDFTAYMSTVDWSILDLIKNTWNSFNVDGSVLNNIVKMFQKFIKDNQPIWDWIGNTFGPLITWFIELIKQITPANIASIFVGKGLMDVGKGLRGVTDTIADVFGGLGDVLSTFQSRIKAGSLWQIAKAVALLALSLAGLSFIPVDKLANGMVAITLLFFDMAAVFQAFKGGTIKGAFGAATTLIGLAIAVGILASAIAAIGTIGGEEALESVGIIAALTAVMVGATRFLSATTIGATSFQMISLAWAIKLIAEAFSALAGLSEDEMLRGIISFGTVLLGLYVIVQAMDPASFQTIAKGMVSMAAGLGILALVIKIFSLMDFKETIVKGLLGIGATLLVLGVALNIFPASGPPKLIGLAMALLILTAPIAIFGHMEWPTITKGLLTVLGLLIVIGSALTFFDGSKAASLIAIAISMMLLTVPIAIFGQMDWETLAKGVVTIGVALGFIGLALRAFNKNGLQIAGIAIGITLMAVALTAMLVPIALMGLMPFAIMKPGLLVFGIVLGAIVAALITMPPPTEVMKIAASMLALAGSLAVIMAGVVILGTMPVDVLVKGVVSLVVVLTALLIFLNLLPPAGEMLKIAGALVAVAIGIGALMVEVGLMGEFTSWDSIIRGLVGLGAVLIIVGIAVALMNPTKVALLGAALIVMGAALLVLAYPVILLAGIPWQQLAAGLGVFVAILIAITAAVLVVGLTAAVSIPALLTLGATFLMIGGGVWLLVDALEKAVNLVGRVGRWVGKLFGFGDDEEVKEAGDQAAGASEEIISRINDPLTDQKNIDEVRANAGGLTDQLVAGVNDPPVQDITGPTQVIDKINGDITGPAAAGVKENASGFGSDLLARLSPDVSGVGLTGVDQMGGNIQEQLSGMLSGTGLDINSLGAGMGGDLFGSMEGGFAGQDFASLTQQFGLGDQSLMSGAQAGQMDLNSLMGGVLPEGYDSMLAGGESYDLAKLTQAGQGSMAPYINGVDSAVQTDLKPTFANAGTESIQALEESLPQEKLMEIGSNVVLGMAEGINKKKGDLFASLEEMCQTAIGTAKDVLKIASPSKIFMEIGGYTAEGMSLGLSNGVGKVKDAAGSLSTAAIDSLDFHDFLTPVGTWFADKFTSRINEIKDQIKQFSDARKEMKDEQERLIIATKFSDEEVDPLQTANTFLKNTTQNTIEQYKQLTDVQKQLMMEQADSAIAEGTVAQQAEKIKKLEATLKEEQQIIKDHMIIITDLQQVVMKEQADNIIKNHMVEQMKTAIQTLKDNLNAIEVNPVITPVLDLSEVKKQAADITKLLDAALAKANVDVKLASASVNKQQPQNGGNEQSKQPTSTNDKSSLQVNNTFNVNNESDARRISNRLGTIMNRYQYSRGVVV